MYTRLVHYWKTLVSRAIRCLQKDGRATFFDTSDFPWVSEIEKSHGVIKKELERLLLNSMESIPAFHEVSKEQEVISKGNTWKTFFLYVFGQPIPENSDLCPKTVSAIKQIPGLQTAMFSILAPQTEIPEHCGIYPGLLRYHLGVTLPVEASNSKKVGIRIKNDTMNWREGGSLIFDDSHPHAAWNRTDSVRVVLFIDFERPFSGITKPFFRFLNRLTIRAIAKTDFVQRPLAYLNKGVR